MPRGATPKPFEETRRYECFVVVCREAETCITLPPLNMLYRVIGERMKISTSTARFHTEWLIAHEYLYTNRYGALVVNHSKLILPPLPPRRT